MRMQTKTVHVVSYPRFKLGKWEHVSAHYRSLPSR